MKIVLLHFESPEPLTYPYSLALAYLKAVILVGRESWTVQPEVYIVDARRGESAESVARRCLELEPTLLGLSLQSADVGPATVLCEAVAVLQPDLTIVFGGPAVRGQGRELLKRWDWLDFVIKGEGEATFLELVAGLIKQREFQQYAFHDVLGLISRRDGEIVETLDRPPVDALDEVPSPYSTFAHPVVPLDDVALLETSRGCRFYCGFCQYGAEFKRRRNFSFERIQRDLQTFDRLGIKHLVLVDALFNDDQARTMRLIQMIDQIGSLEQVTAWIRLDRLSDELISLFARKRWNLNSGLITSNHDTLERLKRETDLTRVRRNIVDLQGHGAEVTLTLIHGLPGESRQEFLESVIRAMELGVDRLRILPLFVLPGTDLDHHRDSLQLKRAESSYRLLSSPSFGLPDLIWAEELGRLAELVHNVRSYRRLAERATRLVDCRADSYLEALVTWVDQYGGRLSGRLKRDFRRFELREVDRFLANFHQDLLESRNRGVWAGVMGELHRFWGLVQQTTEQPAISSSAPLSPTNRLADGVLRTEFSFLPTTPLEEIDPANLDPVEILLYRDADGIQLVVISDPQSKLLDRLLQSDAADSLSLEDPWVAGLIEAGVLLPGDF